jgi:hypothetical protein
MARSEADDWAFCSAGLACAPSALLQKTKHVQSKTSSVILNFRLSIFDLACRQTGFKSAIGNRQSAISNAPAIIESSSMLDT